MATYKTQIITELWTKNGSRTGIKPALDSILEVGNQIWLKDRTLDCRIIVARTDNIAYPGDWIDKCVEYRALKPYIPPEPPPSDTMPPPDEIQMRWKNSAGEVIITQDYIKKNVG